MQRTYPKQGDHIRYHMGFTTYHHGIFCGDILERKNVVIHFDAKYLSGKVTNISYRKFAKDFKIEMKSRFSPCFRWHQTQLAYY